MANFMARLLSAVAFAPSIARKKALVKMPQRRNLPDGTGGAARQARKNLCRCRPKRRSNPLCGTALKCVRFSVVVVKRDGYGYIVTNLDRRFEVDKYGETSI